eukprot:jgi/Ulvmu1/11468/UM077_0011.1
MADEFEDDVAGLLDDDDEPSNKKRKAQTLDDDDDEVDLSEDDDQDRGNNDDDEEEEEEAEEAEQEDVKRKKIKKLKRSRFIDDVADVDDDEEDEDEDYDDEVAPGEKFIEEDGEDAPRIRDHMVFRERDIQEEQLMDVEDEEKVNEYYRNKDRQFRYMGEQEEDVLNQHALLPSMQDDPKLWMVKVRAGSEKAIVSLLMSRFLAERLKNKPWGVTSAFCQEMPPHLLGSKKESHIYIESRSERSVQDALEGLRDVLYNRPFVRVPHAEMTDAITVKDTAPHHLKPGSWVRIKSAGVYKGDLAQVEGVDAEGGVLVKVIPRIDYQAIAERIKDRERRRAEGEKLAPFGGARHSGPPPPAHPFSATDARSAGLLVETRRGYDNTYMMDNRRFENGYEVRKLQARAVAELKDPPFQDVQHFVDVGVGGDAARAQRTLLEAASAGTARQFAVGDTVQVAKGELASMRGKVVEIDESRSRVVLLPVGLEGFTEKLDFDMADLQKEVAMGARVKIVAGAHHVGDLGVVAHAADGVAAVLLDATDDTVKVLVNNLVETAQERSGIEALGRYRLNDLVELRDGTVGMIVHLSAATAHLLVPGPEGAPLRTAKEQDIKRPVDNSRRVPAPDMHRQRVTAQSMVEIVDGPHKSKVGTVAHVKMPHLWVQCSAVQKNNGYVVVMSNMTRVKGGARNGGAFDGQQARLNPMSPAAGRSPAYALGGTSNLASPRHDSGGGGRFGGGRGGGFRGSGRFGGGGRGRGRGPMVDALTGKRVRVVRGPHRGYVGMVQHAADTHVRIELDATNKVIMIKREYVEADDGRGSARRTARSMQTPMRAHMTPAYVPEFARQEEPGTAPISTPHILQAASTPGLPATPGTVPITPSTVQAPHTVPTPAAELPATLPAATPGTMHLGVSTPGTMLGGGLASTAMTPGSAPVGRTPGTYVTPGTALAEADAAASRASSYKNYVGAVVEVGGRLGVVSAYDPVGQEFVVLEGHANPPGSAEEVATDGSSARQVVSCDDVSLVPPQHPGEVTVVLTDQSGAAAGTIAELVGLDDTDFIVKYLSSGDIGILPVSALAKLNSRNAASQGAAGPGAAGADGAVAVESPA